MLDVRIVNLCGFCACITGCCGRVVSRDWPPLVASITSGYESPPRDTYVAFIVCWIGAMSALLIYAVSVHTLQVAVVVSSLVIGHHLLHQ